MSFKEKSAVITLAALLLGGGWYFAHIVPLMRLSVEAAPVHAVRFGAMVIGMSAIAIVGHIAVAAYRPAEARAAADERERDFELRASRLGFVTLIAGALVASSSALWGVGGLGVANAVFAAIVAAEVVHYGAFLLLHRVG